MNLRGVQGILLICAGLLVPLGLSCGDEEEASSVASLIEIVEADSSECPSGEGRAVLIGVDQNADGVLETPEVRSRTVICAGPAGDDGDPGPDGTSAAVRTEDEPPGANCAQGGVRFDLGADTDGDGALGAAEVTATAFACNGAPGEDGLESLARTTEATTCETGGIVVEIGVDRDRDGTLDPGEVETTETLCSGEEGLEALLLTEDEPPGPNCPVGGLRLSSGRDLDGSGALEMSEIERTTYVCDAVRALSRVSPELAGTSTACPAGGARVDTGSDNDGDGVLSDGEVLETAYVCAGGRGVQSLVATTPEPAGARCADGGVRIDAGVDVNGDGTLQPAEVNATSFACSGPSGRDGSGGNAIRVSAEPAGASCPAGGTRIETGPDTNGNGVLDDAEVRSTSFVCGGGASEVLVDVGAEPPGAECPNGGRRIRTGTDANQNRVLDPSEVQTTRLVCDTPSTGVPFAITTQRLANAVRNDPYSADITAFGGTGGGYAWRVSAGQLPPGLTVAPTGTPSTQLSGTPTSTGSFAFTVEVEDFLGGRASRAFTLEVTPPPCAPGVNGMVGVAQTDIPLMGATNLVAGYGMDVDAAPGGWAYIIGTSELSRVRKDGSVYEDLEASIGLTSSDLGYEIQIAGNGIYIVDDSSSTTSGRVQRISNDGGATFSVEDMVTFATAPADIRGMEVEGSTLYLMTHGTSDAEIYSADISGTLPAPASLVGRWTTIADCSGLAVDQRFFYTGCDDSTVSPDALVRIDRATLEVTVLIDNDPILDLSSTYNALEAQDLDGNGVADVLWVHGFTDKAYVCAPANAAPGTTFFRLFGTGASSDYGLGLDRSNARLFTYDDSPDLLFRFE